MSSHSALQHQRQLEFAPSMDVWTTLPDFSGPCALEEDDFPFERISEIAELESWRKELHRPLCHIHKWWAQRLGTVFRAVTLGALAPAGTDIADVFYRPARIRDAVVFDPFMGGGTTIAEAAKLGLRVIGRDINPVSHFLVRNAFSLGDRSKILREFRSIERDVAGTILSFYKTQLPDGRSADVLYFFWVKTVPCPGCRTEVELRASRIFARHACPQRHPEARALCPGCGAVNRVRHDALQAQCGDCGKNFDPQSGPANGRQARCPACECVFPIAETVRATNAPPPHRLCAKLALLPDGSKEYAPVTAEDIALYETASRELQTRSRAYPEDAVAPGCNTDQMLGYNYRHWHEMFNDRQLLCLSLLAERIRAVADPNLRELFTCLFSGALEFNNMFASYKGEGTGAVRNIFAHHILKPERTPLEANVWGTPKSSGSFATMFENRILRALDYAEDPFEIRLQTRAGKKRSEKVRGLSERLHFKLSGDYAGFCRDGRVYLSCGDSGATDLADQSVDAVITDPPFFDNVHYSELADFFYVWQRHILGDQAAGRNCTTRSAFEVQNADATQFTERLTAVWAEAHRVLKDRGVLVFTYHHSRTEGWRSMLCALMQADFEITAAHPVKAEMSVAVPKSQAKEPIDLDVILVCRKRSHTTRCSENGDLQGAVTETARRQALRLRNSGRRLSRNDVRVIVMAQFLRRLSASRNLDTALALLDAGELDIEQTVADLCGDCTAADGP